MSSAVLKVGDQVAVMPARNSPDADVLAIDEIAYVGPYLIRLAHGGEYFKESLTALNFRNCIVPATEGHMAAFNS